MINKEKIIERLKKESNITISKQALDIITKLDNCEEHLERLISIIKQRRWIISGGKRFSGNRMG